MVKKTLILVHQVDYDYEVIVGSFSSRRDLYIGWKKYLEEYTRIEKREATERLKINLGKENRSKEDIVLIKRDRDTLQRINEGSFLCHDKAKTLFKAYLVPKNTIRFDRKPFQLDEFFFDDPICPWCLSLDYIASTSIFSMEHDKSVKEESFKHTVQANPNGMQEWGKWAFSWIAWLLGLPPLHFD